METTNDTKLTSLIEMIKEDRIEIREIRRRLYSTVQYFLIAYIAIVGFGIESNRINQYTLLFVILLFISWIYFYFTKRDIHIDRNNV